MKPNLTLPGRKSYFGGKGAPGVAHAIINQIPLHNSFISGFLGHCAIMRYKHPAKHNYGIDANPKVCALWEKAQPKFHLKIRNYNFLTAYESWMYGSSTFLYLDPPYPHDTRRSAHRYEHELTDDQHEKLLNRIKQLDCMVAISTYDNPLYQEKLSRWRKIQFKSMTRSGEQATETLYMNYPEPKPIELHDARFFGQNFREREKSKRRLDSLIRKIERLEPAEAARLVELINEQFPNLASSDKSAMAAGRFCSLEMPRL
jgi:site-specific DNA-adenine methylase